MKIDFLKKLKPCPLCGYDLSDNPDDSFHPSGSYMRYDKTNDLYHYVGRQNRKPEDLPLYILCCPVSSGGCGLELTVESEEDALFKWNRRSS